MASETKKLWLVVEDWRQVRPDHLVEVRVLGVWRLAYTVEWSWGHTLPRPVRVGDLCRLVAE